MLIVSCWIHLQLPVNLSCEARDLIQRLLKKNPRERLPLTELLDHPFMKRRSRAHDSIDSGLFTMSTLPSVITPSIKMQDAPVLTTKLRRSNSSRDAGPVMAFPPLGSVQRHSAHSLPDHRPQIESRPRHVQSWGEPCGRPKGSPHQTPCDGNRLSGQPATCGQAESVNLSARSNVHCSHRQHVCQSSCSHVDTCHCHVANQGPDAVSFLFLF